MGGIVSLAFRFDNRLRSLLIFKCYLKIIRLSLPYPGPDPMNRLSEPQPSSKIGLRNLDNRYKLITKRNIIIENNFERFTVKLPIIRF